MSNQEKTSATDCSIGLELLRFENICYLNLIKRFIDVFRSEKTPLKYGVEEGLDTYFSFGLQLDTAYIYMNMKLLNT